MRKALLIFAVLGLAGSLWAADPFIGTWKLNVAKSKASDPSWMPKSEIMKSEALDNGLKNTCDGVDSDGTAYHYIWSPKYDGSGNCADVKNCEINTRRAKQYSGRKPLPPPAVSGRPDALQACPD